MQNLAAAQRRYDRQPPMEGAEPALADPMDQLRDDLTKKNNAQDISSAVFDAVFDSDDDLRILRLLAADKDAEAIAILKATLRVVAERRVLR